MAAELRLTLRIDVSELRLDSRQQMYQLLPYELWSDKDIPPWLEMWALAIGIYAICKLITWWLGDGPAQPLALSAGYLIAWPGMNAKRFFAIPPNGVERPMVVEWLAAIGKSLLGLGMLFGLVRLVPDRFPLLEAWLGMGGVVFTLHFGLFHLLSCGWRLLGIDAEPLMQWPILSTSLTEFWSRRWNIAFRDLTYQLLFRPLTSRVGAAWALWLGFLASGVVHDLVVSLPARGGYGLPTLYFVLQPAFVTLQRSQFGRAWGLGRGITGWLFTAACLILPAPLLFHPPFLRNVVIPFLTAMNARSEEAGHDCRSAQPDSNCRWRAAFDSDCVGAGAAPSSVEDRPRPTPSPASTVVLGVWRLRGAGHFFARRDLPRESDGTRFRHVAGS